MSGVFTYVSFLAVYYLLLVGLDLFGSFMEYRKSILMGAQDPSTIKFKVDFNSDLAMASLIYLISYYSGLFDG